MQAISEVPNEDQKIFHVWNLSADVKHKHY